MQSLPATFLKNHFPATFGGHFLTTVQLFQNVHGWTLHVIICFLLCYPVSFHMLQLLLTGGPISFFYFVLKYMYMTNNAPPHDKGVEMCTAAIQISHVPQNLLALQKLFHCCFSSQQDKC